VARDTGSSFSPELAAALHRLRSTLARLKAEFELAEADGDALPISRLLDDLKQALELVDDVEAASLNVVRVLVVDDDERLGELTARSLRRLGYDAESIGKWRQLRAREVVVFDLGLVASLDADARAALKAAKPIVVTGAADTASRFLATSLDASDYLLKPVDTEDLAAAINRRQAFFSG
jgi:CheY-like chemotaxis protein